MCLNVWTLAGVAVWEGYKSPGLWKVAGGIGWLDAVGACQSHIPNCFIPVFPIPAHPTAISPCPLKAWELGYLCVLSCILLGICPPTALTKVRQCAGTGESNIFALFPAVTNTFVRRVCNLYAWGPAVCWGLCWYCKEALVGWRAVGFQHWSWWAWTLLISWTLTLAVFFFIGLDFVLFFLFIHALSAFAWGMSFCLCVHFALINSFLGHVLLWFHFFLF